MIISATIVYKPRGAYRCEHHGGEIVGTNVRLFGAAETGDRPYEIRLCVPCAQDTARASGSGKIVAALGKGGLL